MPGARSLLLEDRALGVRILVNAGTLSQGAHQPCMGLRC
jgi:hypothetical protein